MSETVYENLLKDWIFIAEIQKNSIYMVTHDLIFLHVIDFTVFEIIN